MISPSLVMNSAAPVPPTAGSEAAPGTAPGFGLAMAAAQAGTRAAPGAAAAVDAPLPSGEASPASLAMISGLLAGAILPAAGASLGEAAVGETRVATDADPLEDAGGPAAEGMAGILAQLLAGAMPPASAPQAPTAPSEPEPAVAAVVAEPARPGIPLADEGDSPESPQDARATAAGTGDPTDPEALAALAAEIPEPSGEPVLAGRAPEQPVSASNAPASAGAASQAVQAATAALRDVAAPATFQAPAHATLRESVGTARWADELGNRLVLMSVRGQQQGSLTLTPEHLGPVEVQISVHRDTANVWFGAQHADTRAALVDALPRLRELLAASGLSLGQSGVSEQAPREGFGAPSGAGAPMSAQDPDTAIEPASPAWRVWRPGLIDTYA